MKSERLMHVMCDTRWLNTARPSCFKSQRAIFCPSTHPRHP